MSSASYSPLLNRRYKGGSAFAKFSKVRDSVGCCKAQQQNKQNQLQQQQQQHHGLFGRKGWIRLPGLGSSHASKGKI
jgi:hypothetical protein